VTDDSTERTPENEAALARFVAQEVRRDGRIPHFTAAAVAAVIEEAERRAGRGRLTLRLRELGGLVRIAGDVAASEGSSLTEAAHVERARTMARSAEEQMNAVPASPPVLHTVAPLPRPGTGES
jgi:Lon-like ATP-dependent protease